MTVLAELQDAATAIHARPAHTPYDEAVASLLDQVALTTPASVIETQASPITRKALAVARASWPPAKAVAR